MRDRRWSRRDLLKAVGGLGWPALLFAEPLRAARAAAFGRHAGLDRSREERGQAVVLLGA